MWKNISKSHNPIVTEVIPVMEKQLNTSNFEYLFAGECRERHDATFLNQTYGALEKLDEVFDVDIIDGFRRLKSGSNIYLFGEVHGQRLIARRSI